MDFLLGVAASLLASSIAILVARYRHWIVLGDARRTWLFGRRLEAAGISNFFTSRKEYSLYRDSGRLTDYLASATSRIDIAGYWLAQGNEMESVADSLVSLVAERPGLVVRVSLIDPESPHLAGLSSYLGLSMDDTENRLRSSLRNLSEAKARAEDSVSQRFSVLTYVELPVASAIMLDYGRGDGRTQLDFKPFRAPRSESFTIELTGPSQFYSTCSEAWMALVDSSTPYEAP